MSTEAAVLPPLDGHAPITRPGSGATRDLHVKGGPEAVWCRARCNATLSGMAFKAFIIKLLEECTPFPRQDGTSRATCP